MGWLITQEGITVDPSKVAGLSQWPRQLHNVKEVRCTLGILGYQRPFIWGYAQIAKPLTELTCKGIKFHWEEQHTKALNWLIDKVSTAPVLKCLDPEKQYHLEVDALAYALGTVLFQNDADSRRQDVVYFLKVLLPPKWNYDIWD